MSDKYLNKQELFINSKYFCFCDEYIKSGKDAIELHAKVTIDSNIPVFQSSMDIQYQAVQAKCPYCGNELIPVDNKIFDQVKKLNEKGYKTKFSCEGHDFDDSAYIWFEGPKFINDKYRNIEGWYFDKPFILNNGSDNYAYIIRPICGLAFTSYFNYKGIKFEDEKRKYLNSLDIWIDSLPNIKE